MAKGKHEIARRYLKSNKRSAVILDAPNYSRRPDQPFSLLRHAQSLLLLLLEQIAACRLDDRTAGVGCKRPAVAEPDNQTINSGDQPKQHFDEVYPDSMLHADLTTLTRCGMIGDVDLAKDSKKSGPENTETAVSMIVSHAWLVRSVKTYKRMRSQAQNQ